MLHNFWGKVNENWAGYSSDVHFSHPFFKKQNVDVLLNHEYNEDYEAIETPPDQALLDEFELTYQKFCDQFDSILADIKQLTFERYQKLYANYYENTDKSGEAALGIENADYHSNYIKDILYLRISKHNIIRILIHYDLDEEHGLEIRIKNGKIEKIDGISET